MAALTVFLASKTEHENHILRKKLEPICEQMRCSFVSTHPQGLTSSIDTSMAVVILNFNEWTWREAQHLTDLREAGYHGHVLIMVKSKVLSAIQELEALDENVVFLEKPFEIKDLNGIVQKMLSARSVAQRIHRRYNTMQDAEVEFSGREDRFVSRVRNLSKGGAYIEFSNLAPAKVGEILKVRFELKEMNRSYTMPAKIVWTSRSSLNGGTAIGVEFVGPGDIERNILGGY